ncbi:MAG: diguanylate cyclase [Lysobacteraceae bacterium]
MNRHREGPTQHPGTPAAGLRERVRARLRADFRLQIICFFGACAVLGILPFALLRFTAGQWVVGLIDLGIIAAILGVVSYAWSSGNTQRAATIAAITNTVGCILVFWILGRSGTYWAYMVVLANFLLLNDRRWATLCSVMLPVAALLNAHLFASVAELATFVVTLTLVGAFAYVFASRSEREHRDLERQARLDSLTGVANRRQLEADLDALVTGRRGDAGRVGLAVIDIDHFKQVNDTHGHEAGDRVLCELVAIIGANVRRRDGLYRMGGEEFVLLLDGMDADSLAPVLETLRNRIGEQLRTPDARQVTVSMGAAMRLDGETWQDWLFRADVALFDAKQGGRNRVRLSRGLRGPVDRGGARAEPAPQARTGAPGPLRRLG